MKFEHITSTKQFLKRDLLDKIFKIAEEFERKDKNSAVPKILEGKILATVFYEPSTRTRFSFESAMLKLGGDVISAESAGNFSSAIKGETLEDAVRIVAGYADMIVLRHPEVGSIEKAAKVSPVPIISAGDGSGEHPTQALLDLYTIKRELGRIDNFSIALVGDLLYGRTIHSLIHLLASCRKVKVFLNSPDGLRLPEEYKSFLKRHKITFYENGQAKKLESHLPFIDVLYVTRVQRERFISQESYDRVNGTFSIGKRTLKLLNKKAIIMHPLPRVNEIHPSVDSDLRAVYFRQARNGLYVRMTLLASLNHKMKDVIL